MKRFGFVSILTVGQDATPKRYRHPMTGKGNKSERVAIQWAGQHICLLKSLHPGTPIMQAMVVGLEAANAVLPSSLCANPMLPLAGMLAIFQAMLDSPFVAPKDKA